MPTTAGETLASAQAQVFGERGGVALDPGAIPAGRASMHQTSADAPRFDRRSAVRVPVRLPACRLLFPGDGPPREARVVNLSGQGVGLECAGPLTPGSSLVVWLPGVLPGRGLYLAARVAHAAPGSNGAWHTGCRFARAFRVEWLDYLQS